MSNDNCLGFRRYLTNRRHFDASSTGTTERVVANGIFRKIDNTGNSTLEFLVLSLVQVRFKHTVLDAGAEPFEYFCKLIAPPVVWNIVRNDIEHCINLPKIIFLTFLVYVVCFQLSEFTRF